MKGIDVSMHNGTIDFASVKNDGIAVVIIKATEGVDYVDPYLEHHYEGAKAEGLNIGFYHFMSERTSPTQQANDFWNAIKDKEFNVIPCLDIETNNMGRSTEEISERCIEFLQQFKSLSGLDCMIYTGGYFGRDSLDSRVKQYKGWIAHYGADKPMETGFEIIGHQYTEKGSVNGVYSDCCDVNNFSEEIFINGGTKKVNNIIICGVGADERAAKYLADYLKCPVVTRDNLTQDVISGVQNIFVVGGAWKPKDSAVLLAGGDRFDTMQVVLKYISK